MQSKRCRECNQVKPLGEFYVHSMMADGHLNKCKICVKERIQKYRRANPDRCAEIDRRKYDKAKADPEFMRKRIEYQRKKRTFETRRAHKLAQRHLQKSRPVLCELCQERPSEHAHHPDYSKPLSVLWLCARCHHRLHHSKEPIGANT